MAPKLSVLVRKYEAIKRSIDRAEEVSRGEPLDAEDRSRPFAPATATDIKAFERKIGFPLPPSYRQFLGLHNGWQCFWGSMWISGVSGKALSCVRSRLKAGKQHLLDDAGWDPHKDLVLGADDNGGFLVFSSKVQKNGEREVLDCPRGFTENTFKSFADLLAVQHRCREKDIARLR